MATRIFGVLTLALSTIGLLSASTSVTFKVMEPVSIAGVPPVTLGPGTYILRKVDSSSGVSAVQVLSKRRDYVYTTVLTIPAVRLHPDDKQQIHFSETSSGIRPRCISGFHLGKMWDTNLSIPTTYRLLIRVPHPGSCNSGSINRKTRPLRPRGARQIISL